MALLAILVSIPVIFIVYTVADQSKSDAEEAKRKSEEPQRAADYSQNEGYSIGQKMFIVGNVTGIWKARTEAEVQELANYIWLHPDDSNLKTICDGTVRVTGGDFDSAQSQESFVSGFVQSYIKAIDDYKRRNQPIY